MNLDKIIANMRQNQAIYQTKASKLYAEMLLITNIFSIYPRPGCNVPNDHHLM